MSEGVYLVKNLTPEQVASVIDTVKQSELTDLVWKFRFHRKVSSESLKNAKAKLTQLLINLESFASDSGLSESETLVTDVEDIHVYIDPKKLLGSENLYSKIASSEYPGSYMRLSDTGISEVYFYADPEIVLSGDIAKIARAGLQEASAQTRTAQKDSDYRSELSIRGGPEEFVLNVANNRYIWSPTGGPGGTWLAVGRVDESTKCCNRLYEMLKDI